MPNSKKLRVKKKMEVPVSKRKKREVMEERRLRNLQCLELRQTGATYEQIARTFNLTDASHARKCVQSAIDRWEYEAAKEVVQMDLIRLDEMQMRATHDMRQNGNLNQIDRIMRIMEFRYRLLGVNDETVRSLQGEHGIATSTTINNKNQVMVVQASPENESEFIGKMMRAVGINPDSPEAKQYLEMHEKSQGAGELPMLEGSANEELDMSGTTLLPDDEIVDAEIVED
jgi:hypothetical protein